MVGTGHGHGSLDRPSGDNVHYYNDLQCSVGRAGVANGWFHTNHAPSGGLLHGRGFKNRVKPALLLFDHRQQ